MKKKMTFSDLVQKIAEETGATQKTVHDLLTETIALNNENLLNEEKNTIPGLGKFSLKWHKVRNGRNPQDGSLITIPGHYSLNFKAQASLRKQINRKYAHLTPELIHEEPTDFEEEPINIPKNKEKEKPIESEPTKQEDPQKEHFIIFPKTEKPKGENTQKDDFGIPPRSEKPIEEEIQKEHFIVPPKREEPKNEKVQKEHFSSPPKNKKSEIKPKQTKKRTSWWWLLLLLLPLLFLVYLFWPQSTPKNTKNSQTTEVVEKPIATQKTAATNKAVPPNETKLSVQKQNTAMGVASATYQVQANEYLYQIARKHYKKAAIWPLIYQANKNKIPNPSLLTLGTEIYLPSLEGKANNLTAKDKKELAAGYVEIYLYYVEKNRNRALSYLWVANRLDKEIIQNNKNRIRKNDLDTVNHIEGEVTYN